MPSTNPFESASPRPRPVSLSVSPRRWNGRNTAPRRSTGIPGPRSTTRSSTRSWNELAARRTRRSGGLWRTAFASRLTTTRCSSTASASTGRRSSGRSSSTAPGPRPSSSRAGKTMSARSVGARVTPSAPACTRLTSSRLVTSSARESRLSAAVSSSSARSVGGSSISVERRALTAADAEVSGRRRSWPTAASSAERRRSVSASSSAASAASASAPCSMACSICVAMTPNSRRSDAARSCPCSSSTARLPIGTFVIRSSPAGSPSVTRGSPSTRRRTPVSPNASRVRVTIACRASSPRSTLPAIVASSWDSAAARWATRVRRAAWSTT